MSPGETLAAQAAVDRHAKADMRVDLALIAGLVQPGTRALDVGCGDGALLACLVREKGVDGRGIELSQAGVNACVAHGLSVVQGDADTDLRAYPTGAFDYAILSQTLQATVNPRAVLRELVRIGRHVIVSVPNFGHWRVRWTLITQGRMPVTGALPYAWYDTPNIHMCTILDMIELARAEGLIIEQALTLDRHGNATRIQRRGWWANLFGEQAVFVLRAD